MGSVLVLFCQSSLGTGTLTRALTVQDLTTKLKLKIAALKALPPDLQEEAAAEDDTPFPLNRQMFTHTPPIPGFQEQQQQASRRQGSRRLGTRQ